ncbi:TetR/AcrR family transcriptional regulator [Pseudonocardia sp. RS010]|uniref:TetR/AcrR family transcriptional regulator n=1 Tax=Pseudonocardia sp. RS010 TaxID=3385979 RepID=UPI0039A3AB95
MSTPRGRKGEETRSRILDAAAAAFRAKGYKESTLADIAALAGTKVGSLYYHFASREELVSEVLAVARQRIRDFLEDRRRTVGQAPPRGGLRAEIDAHLGVVLGTEDDYVPAYLRIIDQVSEETRAGAITAAREYVAHLGTVVRRAREDGEIRADLDPVVSRMLLLGAANSTADWYRKRRGGIALEDLRHIFATLYFEGLTADRPVARERVGLPTATAIQARATVSHRPREGTRDRIIDAAAVIFMRDGYASARLADVAALAGIQVGSLYHHFASREALVSELLEESAERIHAFVFAEVAALPPGADAATQLATMITAQVVSLLTGPHTSVYMRISRQAPASLRARSEAAQRRYLADWAKVVQRGADEGTLRADLEGEIVCRLIFGAMNDIVSWYSVDGPSDPARIALVLAETVLEGLGELQGRRPVPPRSAVEERLARVEALLADLTAAVHSLTSEQGRPPRS